MALFLVASSLSALGVGAWLRSWQLGVENLFGTGISSRAQPLFLPGTVFLAVSLITFVLHRIDRSAYRRAWRSSLAITARAAVALVFTARPPGDGSTPAAPVSSWRAWPSQCWRGRSAGRVQKRDPTRRF